MDVTDVPHQCPMVKDHIRDVLVSQVLKGLQSLHLMLWLLKNVSFTDKSFVPQFLSWWWGHLKCLHQRCNSSAGRNGPGDVLKGVYHTMSFLPLN